MGVFIPVCSGASKDLMPSPRPEAILVSVASCGTNSSIKSVQKVIQLSESEKIFLDNGMYTYFQKWQKGERVICDENRPIYPPGVEMNLTAIHAIRCAKILKPDVLIVTDLPVPALNQRIKPDHGDEEFQFLLVTYHNLIRAKETSQLQRQYCTDLKLYFSFQGYNINQLERILKELGELSFQGFCFATRALSWNKLIAFMLLLNQKGIRKIHILAGSTLPIMAVGAFMARNIFDEVSYDSHNWLVYSSKDNLRLYGSMKSVRAVKQIDLPQNILSLKCDCLHCRGRSIEDIREMEHGPEKFSILAQHNYYIETQTAKAYFLHSETPAMLRDFLLSMSQRTKLIKEIYEALSAVDKMKEKLSDYNFTRKLANYIFSQFKET